MSKKAGIPITVWLGLLLVIPLAALFLLSLAAAAAIGSGVFALYYLLRSPAQPLPRRRETSRDRQDGTIELDPRDYRRLPGE